jgi:HEAT repeat protein
MLTRPLTIQSLLCLLVTASTSAALDLDRDAVATEVKEALAGLEDVDAAARVRAASSLSSLGKHARSAVPALIRALKDSNAAVRRAAAEALGRIGRPEAREAIAPLVETLQDSDAKVREEAAGALGFLRAHQAVPALVALFKDPSRAIRSKAAFALNLIGADAEKAVPELCKLLKDDDAHTRWCAAEALRSIGHADAAPALQEALQDAATSVRLASARALWRVARKPEAVPVLMAELGYGGDLAGLDLARARIVRDQAIYGLADIGPPARAAVPALMAALPSDHDSIGYALSNIGPDAVPALIKALASDDPRSRWFAAEALVRFDEEGRAAVPALLKLLKDKDPFVRSAATRALGQVGADVPELVAPLTAALKDEEPRVRKAAVQALGAMALTAKAAIPALVETVGHDGDRDVRLWAIFALSHMGPAAKPAVAVIPSALQNHQLRGAAAELVMNIGPEAKDTIPALRPLLDDPDAWLRWGAVDALGGIGPEARGAKTALIKALADPEYGVRHRAATALARLGANDAAVAEALARALKDPSAFVRVKAALALVKVDATRAQEAVAALRAALADADDGGTAAAALGELGPAARDAAPALVALLKDRESWWRGTAAKSLGQIGAADGVAPALLEALQDRDSLVRVRAAVALCGLERRYTQTAIPVLSTALQARDFAGSTAREEAAEALGRLGPEAKAAIPALRAALQDDSGLVRRAVRAALLRTDPRGKR